MLNKGKNDKLMSLDTDHDNLLKTFKTVWTNIEH